MRSLRTAGMMASSSENVDIYAFEEVLACNIKDVLADFCLADADIIRLYADNQLHGNMDEIMTSSAELLFKHETLSYGHVAHVRTGQNDHSCVVLDIEFAHDAVTVFFQLIFGDFFIGLRIRKVLLDPVFKRSEFSPSSFSRMVSSARLKPLPQRFQSPYCLAESAWH